MKINPSIRQRPMEAKARTLKPNQKRDVLLPLNTGCPKILIVKTTKDKSFGRVHQHVLVTKRS